MHLLLPSPVAVLNGISLVENLAVGVWATVLVKTIHNFISVYTLPG